MADKTATPNHLAGDPQRRIAAATAIGMNALKPMIHFQVSMLRMWADSIEKLAGNYEKKLEETATTVEEQSDKERAA
ncbi:putative ATP-grasp superfamily ATP-dependent carboligase [Bradyrhizobium sp. USDA 377]